MHVIVPNPCMLIIILKYIGKPGDEAMLMKKEKLKLAAAGHGISMCTVHCAHMTPHMMSKLFFIIIS